MKNLYILMNVIVRILIIFCGVVLRNRTSNFSVCSHLNSVVFECEFILFRFNVVQPHTHTHTSAVVDIKLDQLQVIKDIIRYSSYWKRRQIS